MKTAKPTLPDLFQAHRELKPGGSALHLTEIQKEKNSMLSVIVIISAVLLVLIASAIFRLIANPYRIRHPYFGPYGYYGYGRGYRRRHFPAGLLSIFTLVALDRIFGRRW